MVKITDINEGEFSNFFFSLSYLDCDFAKIHSNPDEDSYAISWNGLIDFSRINNTALYFLPEVLMGDNFSLVKSSPFVARNLIIDGKLVEYSSPVSYSQIFDKDYFKIPNASFAIYNVIGDVPDCTLEYSLTASNPLFYENTIIGIRQPVSRGFKPGLLKFIFDTHKNSVYFENADINSCSQVIDHFLQSR